MNICYESASNDSLVSTNLKTCHGTRQAYKHQRYEDVREIVSAHSLLNGISVCLLALSGVVSSIICFSPTEKVLSVESVNHYLIVIQFIYIVIIV